MPSFDKAVKAAAVGGFVNQGQVCVSTERIVVDASIADEFVAKLKQKAMTMTAGDPVSATLRSARSPAARRPSVLPARFQNSQILVRKILSEAR
jgi:acyl-CoA reductase-like NAD-dependent aldehyde dehydrogenase